jgi:hypothetical protein
MLGSLRFKKRSAVRAAPPFLDFGVDRARHDVARRKLQAFGIVFLHETLAVLVAQDAAFSAHGLGDQNSLHSGRPNHSGRMELHEFHVQQLGACVVGESHAITGALPRVRRDLPRFPDAAGGDDHGFGFEGDEPARFAPVAERAADAIAVLQQPRDRAFHENVETHLHAAILQRADHLQAGAIADVAQPLECVAAEGALEDVAARRAIEERAPLLELAHAVGRFLGVQLRHAPVVEVFSSAHGVAEMRSPVVVLVHVGHRRGQAAFSHHRVRFAQQRFADDAHLGALRQRLERGPKTSAARANNQNVVFVGFVLGGIGHSSRMSLITPAATRLMYKSVRATEKRLSQAHSM